MAKPEEAPRSLEDIQREIADVELETKRLSLAQAKRDNQAFVENERRRKEQNKTRMAELAQAQRNHEAMVKTCRHRSGGNPGNVLKGGGIGSFSIITRVIMLDGVTIMLQCSRCRMKLYPPTDALKEASPEKYLEDLKEYNRLLEISREEGIENAELRGPTFMFKNRKGVPIIPERV